MLVHASGRVVLDNVSGSAHASLLQALQPDLPFTCDMAMQVEMKRMAIGGGGRMLSGNATSDPGSCRPKGAGTATAVPALFLSAEHVGNRTTIRIVPATQRRRVLLTAILSEDGALDLSVTPDGAEVLPFIGLPGGARIEGQM